MTMVGMGEYKYEEMNGEFKEILKGKTISKYDTDGNNVGWSNYDSEGNVNDGRFGFSKNITIFDSNGNMVTSFFYGLDGKMDNRWDYKYDTDGNKVEALNYDSNQKLKHKSIDKYDTDDNRVESSYYYPNGSLEWKWIYKYDSNGNMVEELSYYSDGKRNKKSIWKYDSNGNVVEESYNKKDGQSSPKVIYKNEYDTKNRIIEVITYPKIFGGFKTPSNKTIYEYEEY